MANIRAIVQATFSRADSVGKTSDGGYGQFGQLRFLDQRQRQDWDAWSEHPQDDWDYTSGGTYTVEPLPELKACGPRGLPLATHMTLYHEKSAPNGSWEKTNRVFGGVPVANCSNLWREVPLGVSGTKALFFYDGRGAYSATTAYFGELTGRQETDGIQLSDPNLALRMWRYRPPRNVPYGNTYVEVQLLGAAGFGQWSLVLPGPVDLRTNDTAAHALARSWMYPRLGYRQGPGYAWEVVEEFRQAIPDNKVGSTKPYFQYVTLETADGHFLINIDGAKFLYLVPPEQRVPLPGSSELGPISYGGPCRIIVYGAPVAVNLSKMNYPPACYAEYRYKWPIDASVFKVPAEGSENDIATHTVHWAPELANQAVSVAVAPNFVERTDEDGDPANGNETAWYRPQVTFNSASERHRAICYLAQLDFLPTITSSEGLLLETQGQDILVAAGGTLSNRWRNNQCTVTLDCERSAADAWVAELKGNCLGLVVAGMDTEAGAVTATHFNGYLAERPISARQIERRSVRMSLRDGFMRLERKYWQSLGCFQDWDLADAFKRCLNQWGVPDSRIKFADASGTLYLIAAFPGDGPVIPRRNRRGDLDFDFGPTTGAVQGMGELVEACGYQWGWDREGFWFCRPPPVYGGTPDFTLTWNVASSLQPQELESDFLKIETPSGQPFVNNVMVIGAKGDVQEVWWERDTASMHDVYAANFVGDDWWHVQGPGGDMPAAALARQLMNDRLKRSRGLRFKPLDGQVNLWPDQFVQVNVVGHDLGSNDIYQITDKPWNATQQGDYETTFEMVFYQVGV